MPIALTSVFPALAALGAVLGLILLAGRAARLTRAPAGRRLAMLETLALDRTRRLSIVRCDGRELLLVTGGGCDTVVGWLSGQEGAR